MSTSFFHLFPRLYRGLERRLMRGPAETFWRTNQSLTIEAAHVLISKSIEAKSPFCLARLGGVEAKIVLWGRKIPKLGPLGLRLPMYFSETIDGPSNAGIRPRSKMSYKTFADLAASSLQQVDLLAKWNTPLEYAFLDRTGLKPPFCDCELLSPTITNQNHWVEALDGKKVLVISPFETSIQKQLPHLHRIWQSRSWRWKAEFHVHKFPYLIDDDCPQTWEEVWAQMLSVVQAADYDIALFGCGGLGLPLAAAAKKAGRIGLHLGGHLQLLFGIYGQRHLEQEWHARCINDSWIRPIREEVAVSARRVENSCYW